MNSKILLTAVSVIAIMSAPAMAASDKVSGNTISATGQIQENDTPGNNHAFPALKDSDIEKSKAQTKRAFDQVGDALSDEEPAAGPATKAKFVTSTSANANLNATTAENLIGKPVVNTAGKKVASVKDIILDDKGRAKSLVLSDGGFLGLGNKLVAVDYKTINRVESNGDVVIPLTEASLKSSPEFNPKATTAMLASKILDGDIKTLQGDSVASIDNLSFRNGAASQLIVSYGVNQKAVLSFDSLKALPSKDDVDFQLTAKQAAEFENFKKVATK